MYIEYTPVLRVKMPVNCLIITTLLTASSQCLVYLRVYMSKNKKKTLIAKLVHNITFLENVAESVSEDQLWQEKYNCFAEIMPLSDYKYMSIEGLSFGNFITEEYYLFKIRYIDGLTKDLRISFRRKLYSIKRIINVGERDRILNIIAQEIL
jgi:SPP1 family predicted phage head-tail adaptor